MTKGSNNISAGLASNAVFVEKRIHLNGVPSTGISEEYGCRADRNNNNEPLNFIFV